MGLPTLVWRVISGIIGISFLYYGLAMGYIGSALFYELLRTMTYNFTVGDLLLVAEILILAFLLGLIALQCLFYAIGRDMGKYPGLEKFSKFIICSFIIILGATMIYSFYKRLI